MLHVLLLILKITGIVIACILGLVIIVVAAVLFVPVRYKADADYHGKFKAHAKLSWLGILRVLVSYDEELAIKAKALFITIYSNNQKIGSVSDWHNVAYLKRLNGDTVVAAMKNGTVEVVSPGDASKTLLDFLASIKDLKVAWE